MKLTTFGVHYDGDWLVFDILPGLLEAHSGKNSGQVTIIGHRLYAEPWLGKAVYEHPHDYPGPTKAQRLALYAFALGMAFQKNRKQRKRIEEAVSEGWQKAKEKGLL